jgi:hypothetical protein
MNAIVILARILDPIWLDFLNTFKEYKVFMVVDDNSEKYENVENVEIIQIDDNESRENGFVFSCRETIRKPVVSWDKALYYFSKLHPDKFNFIWFIEDDVFLHSQKTLLDIDTQYPTQDLISQKNREGYWPHWRTIKLSHDPPYFNTLVCAVRISSNLLKAIESYATTKGELYFIEAMFPSECRFAGLIQQTIPELDTLHWQKTKKFTSFLKENIYHPLKNTSDHEKIRNSITL